jgi:hypothetical protein
MAEDSPLVALVRAAVSADPAGAPPALPSKRGGRNGRVNRNRAWARYVAIYIARVELGMTRSAVAAYMGTSMRLVAIASQQVENHRDDPGLDGFIDTLVGPARVVLS